MHPGNIQVEMDNAGLTVWLGSTCCIFTHEEFRAACARGKGKKRIEQREQREQQRQAKADADTLGWIA